MSNPERTDQSPETPDSGRERAMMKAQSVLSAKAAMIAERLPRTEPLLRMIEACGFTVVGFEPAPVTRQPVRRVNNSPGSRALYHLLERRGYPVRHDDPSDSGKAVS